MARSELLKSIKCTVCNRVLPFSYFSPNKTSKYKVRTECKECRAGKEKDKRNEKIKNGADPLYPSAKSKKELLYKIKSELCCCVCGEARPWVLDFHHTDPSRKEFTIADAPKFSFDSYEEKVRDEIKKCLVMCANCHREYHYKNKRQTRCQEYAPRCHVSLDVPDTGKVTEGTLPSVIYL